MRLTECAATLREAGPGARITIEAPDRDPITMTLDGEQLVVSRKGEVYSRVSFANGSARVYRHADTRDSTADCLQKCYDDCNGTALCYDKCAQHCL